MADTDTLVYAHIGDLHVTTADQQNYRDLVAIVDVIARDLAHGIDFVYLPGDNADNGTRAQYALVRDAISRLAVPVHVITGDHDMEQGSLDDFYSALDAAPLPKAVDHGGMRCLFLDLSGPGTGGPDFRLGGAQLDWLRNELAQASRDDRRCALFMHTYPVDLRGGGETEAINAALAAREVLLVNMGHTHYNELANDGRTIFAATRSTGQIEEGPVGFSIVAIDRRVVSWRFRALADKGPVVLITAPADRRLANDPEDPDHVPGTTCEMRVRIVSPRRVVRCTCSVDGARDIPLRETAPGRFAVMLDLPESAREIRVEAEDEDGAMGCETIEIARAGDLARARRADGSDADALEAWEARGILGTQLGPNRNGRQW